MKKSQKWWLNPEKRSQVIAKISATNKARLENKPKKVEKIKSKISPCIESVFILNPFYRDIYMDFKKSVLEDNKNTCSKCKKTGVTLFLCIPNKSRRQLLAELEIDTEYKAIHSLSLWDKSLYTAVCGHCFSKIKMDRLKTPSLQGSRS